MAIADYGAFIHFADQSCHIGTFDIHVFYRTVFHHAVVDSSYQSAYETAFCAYYPTLTQMTVADSGIGGMGDKATNFVVSTAYTGIL